MAVVMILAASPEELAWCGSSRERRQILPHVEAKLDLPRIQRLASVVLLTENDGPLPPFERRQVGELSLNVFPRHAVERLANLRRRELTERASLCRTSAEWTSDPWASSDIQDLLDQLSAVAASAVPPKDLVWFDP